MRFPGATHLVILVDGFGKWKWLAKAACKRLLEELEKFDIKVNIQKTRIVDLTRGETFGFPPPCYSSYRASCFYPGGTDSL